jgi:hypothetical protein
MQIHMAIDQRGVVYVSNGHQGGPSFFPDTGKLYSFNADLTQRWVVETTGSLHQGGPALGTDGTLVLVGTENDIWAYRTAPTPAACNLADLTGIGGPPAIPDGLLTGDDFNAFISAFAAGENLADLTGIGGPPSEPDGLITGDDFNAFIAAFAAGCP